MSNLENYNRKDHRPIKVLVKSVLDIKKLIKKYPGLQVIDQYEFMLEEICSLRNPHFRFKKLTKKDLDDFIKVYSKGKDLLRFGNWFYYPWLNQIVHFLPEKEHQEMRTGRNRNLITQKEQDKFYNSKIGVLGMSVGSHVALTLVMMGGAKEIRIADLDIVSGSNLNRIRTGFWSLALPKTIAVARQIYEINPYAKVKIFKKGVNEKNINKFLTEGGKLDVLVEETDDPYLKIRVREFCLPKKIPVIMAADNGDGVIVDVERYDIDKKPLILHGIIKDVKASHFKEVHPTDLPQIIAKIAGAKFAPKRMLDSVAEVGKTIYTWPQLGTAATMCGSVLSNLARRIVLKEDIKSGRYVIDELKMFKKVI